MTLNLTGVPRFGQGRIYIDSSVYEARAHITKGEESPEELRVVLEGVVEQLENSRKMKEIPDETVISLFNTGVFSDSEQPSQEDELSIRFYNGVSEVLTSMKPRPETPPRKILGVTIPGKPRQTIADLLQAGVNEAWKLAKQNGF
jgi:hypothetical protein